MNTIIAQLYTTFQKYTLNGKIDKCPCGCISDEEEAKIYAKPLKALAADDLGFYGNKAMTTWGEAEHYKHFLPRLIEIYSENKHNGWIDLDSIHNKLAYANWEEWPAEEKTLIYRFVEADWRQLVNEKESELDLMDFESYEQYFDFGQLLRFWEFPEHKMALKNFVHFFYLNGNEIFYNTKKVKINTVDRKLELVALGNREGLIPCLEELFFKCEQTDPRYSDEISTVLQMIEGFRQDAK